MHHIPVRYHMQDTSKFLRIDDPAEYGVSPWYAATVGFVAGFIIAFAVFA